ncbi:MAG: hypothetical protein Ct9H90mP27_4300 [Gammaproteobacteria bacterium]|nr:MAG: hypothetical protein Ct9H90mP27_4300 [Gammaproteobacteria bacterium]
MFYRSLVGSPSSGSPWMLESVIESWIRSLLKAEKDVDAYIGAGFRVEQKVAQGDEYRKGRLLSKLANHIKETRGGKKILTIGR